MATGPKSGGSPAPLLQLGQDFQVNANIATRRAVLLGQPDAGKTNGLTVIAEGLLKINVPVVVMDWKGDLWGLRSSRDGRAAGFPVAVFGGDHGDVAIDERDGREIGHLVAIERIPVIIDLSAFASDAARRRFAASFLRAFFQAKRTNVAPHPLLIDEYQQFAPEKPYEGEKELLAATEQIIGMGRKRGIGVVGTSLRAATLSKSIVELSDIYFFMQIAGKNDLGAISDTIKRVASAEVRDQLLAQMPGLHRGEVVVYSPSWLRVLEKHRFSLRTTFDSSKTPEVGGELDAREPTVFAMPDLPSLRARIEATREKREHDDPEALRTRIAELERRVTLTSKPTPPVKVFVPILSDDERDTLRRIATTVDGLAAAFRSTGSALEAIRGFVIELEARAKGAVEESRRIPLESESRTIAAPVPPAINGPTRRRDRADVAPGGRSEASSGSLPLAPAAVLAAVGSLSDGRGTKSRVAALAGYSSRKSTFRNALSTLRTRQLVETPKGDVILTAAGRKMVPRIERKSTADTIRMWRGLLKESAPVALFDVLVATYPEHLLRAELATRAKIDPTKSTFRNALSRLRVQGLITEREGRVALTEEIFS